MFIRYLVTILSIALFSQVTLAKELNSYKQVAIGIATPGPGASVMGHAFLLFLDSPQLKSDSIAIQYNVSPIEGEPEPSGLVGTVQGFLGYSKRFSVQMTPGQIMMNQYRLENRSILLFYLKLSPEQISKLAEFLNTDMQLRNSKNFKDYSFLDHNCLTEALRAVNSVIPNQQEKFFFVDRDKIIFTYLLKQIALPLYLRNAPFSAVHSLKTHPLVRGHEVITPAIINDAEDILELREKILSFNSGCMRSQALAQNVESLVGKEDVRGSSAFLEYLQKQSLSCPGEKESYREIVLAIYNLASTMEAKMNIEGFLP
ncbi:MAG: DUF4105 domain-containing protein [Bdellovibrio sp.]|nr:DUF4105 domain-containing protein [Bdellovibrio sp.]